MGAYNARSGVNRLEVGFVPLGRLGEQVRFLNCIAAIADAPLP